MLVLVLRLEQDQEFNEALKQDVIARNRRLPDFKRVGGYVIWDKDFPRTAAMKIKRMRWRKRWARSLEPGRRGRNINRNYELPRVSDSGEFLAVVNPAAGGGRCRKLMGPALDRLRAGGIDLKVVETTAPGQATLLVRDAYAKGFRKFIAVGGDGTSYEIVNGLFPGDGGGQPTLAFLPLGTGNSFSVISAIAVWSLRSMHCWRAVPALVTSFALPTRPAHCITSTC